MPRSDAAPFTRCRRQIVTDSTRQRYRLFFYHNNDRVKHTVLHVNTGIIPSEMPYELVPSGTAGGFVFVPNACTSQLCCRSPTESVVPSVPANEGGILTCGQGRDDHRMHLYCCINNFVTCSTFTKIATVSVRCDTFDK